MDNLRSKVIRLAFTQPDLRPHLLPLLVKTAVFIMLKPGEKEELEALVEPESGKTYKEIEAEKNALSYDSKDKEKRKLYEKRLNKLLLVMQRKQKEKRGLTLSSSSKYVSRMPASGDWKHLGGTDVASAILQGGEPVGWMVERERTSALRAPGVSYSYGHSTSKEFTAYTLDGKEIPGARDSRATDVLDRVYEHLQKNPVKTARITQELLRVNYSNLGDFGGTDPISDMWVLEVAGPTFDIREDLKRLGLKWDPGSKTWKITAILYKYGGRRNAQYESLRNLQKAAFPKLQAMAKDYNAKAEAANDALVSQGDLKREIEDIAKLGPRLERFGIKIRVENPNRYSADEGKVMVSGNTYPVSGVMKKYHFRWDPSQKTWWTPMPEFFTIQARWMAEVVKVIPQEPPEAPAKAVFSDMHPQELNSWIEDHYDVEGLTMDGERSMSEGVAEVAKALRSKTPKDQQDWFKKIDHQRNRY
jgi:hypothetical protein